MCVNIYVYIYMCVRVYISYTSKRPLPSPLSCVTRTPSPWSTLWTRFWGYRYILYYSYNYIYETHTTFQNPDTILRPAVSTNKRQGLFSCSITPPSSMYELWRSM